MRNAFGTIAATVGALSLGVFAGCSATSATGVARPSAHAQSDRSAVVALTCPRFRTDVVKGSKPLLPAPTGATAAVMCHYVGPNETLADGTLVRAVNVPNPAQFATQLDTGARVATNYQYCPADIGTREVFIFVADGHTTYVEQDVGGCGFVTSLRSSNQWWLSLSARKAVEAIDPLAYKLIWTGLRQ